MLSRSCKTNKGSYKVAYMCRHEDKNIYLLNTSTKRLDHDTIVREFLNKNSGLGVVDGTRSRRSLQIIGKKTFWKTRSVLNDSPSKKSEHSTNHTVLSRLPFLLPCILSCTVGYSVFRRYGVIISCY